MTPTIRKIITAPTYCSLAEHPEITIRFFREAESAFKAGRPVEYDLSETEQFTDTAAAILVGQMKDRNINRGLPSTVTFPKDDKVRKSLKRLGINKKIGSDENLGELDDIPTQKVTNLKVANEVARSVVQITSRFLYGEEKRMKDLYAILIEMMANTNNHASSVSKVAYPWFLFIYPDAVKKSVKFVFLDFGEGIFESIPVKQHITRLPVSIHSRSGDIKLYIRGEELKTTFDHLSSGLIKSRTGIASRGKGIPKIVQVADNNLFNRFLLIANDAYIDIKSNEVSAMNENFSGTMFFFEINQGTHNE